MEEVVEMPFYTDTTSLGDAVVVFAVAAEPEGLAFPPYYSATAWAYTTETTTMPFYAPCLRESVATLNELGALPANWDSYGADPVTEVSLDTARRLLLDLQDALLGVLGELIKPKAVLPLNDGGIQVEWEGAEGEFELEIAGDGSLSYLLIEREEQGRHFTEATDVTVREVLERIGSVVGSRHALQLVA